MPLIENHGISDMIEFCKLLCFVFPKQGLLMREKNDYDFIMVYTSTNGCLTLYMNLQQVCTLGENKQPQ